MTGTKGRSGGKREGAGRKPVPPDQRHIRRSVTFSPEADAIIGANRCAGESYAATIDRIVREWDASQCGTIVQ